MSADPNIAREDDDKHEAVPAGQKGSWASFLKSITTFTGDLSALTAPSFILSGVSLIEYSAYWAEHPEGFVEPALEKDPQKRALSVLKWYLSTLKGQFSSRNEQHGSEKKPLNPILGELFYGKWQSPDGSSENETLLTAEQVSHHPPITAYHINNKKHGIYLQGQNAQKSGFSGRTITVKQVGHAILHIKEFDEHYLITLPSLRLEGLFYGAPYVELSSSSYIQSSSGFSATIDYSGKGWFSGKKNSFTATLSKTGDGHAKKNLLYTISGVWTDSFTVKDEKTGHEELLWKTAGHPRSPLHVLPVTEQTQYESRKVWEKVANALNTQDYDTASREKSKIENAQRNLRKEEKERDTDWQRKHFDWHEEDPQYNKLASLNHHIQPEKEGSWIFKE